MSEPDHITRVQQLFVEHISTVKHFVFSLLPNPNAAEDVVQEVFLTITAKAHDFEPETNFKAWVLTIARFKVFEQLRREKRENDRLSDEVIDLLAAEADNPDAGREASEIRALSKCLRKLGTKARRMIELKYRKDRD